MWRLGKTLAVNHRADRLMYIDTLDVSGLFLTVEHGECKRICTNRYGFACSNLRYGNAGALHRVVDDGVF